jgi:hypothetical protein
MPLQLLELDVLVSEGLVAKNESLNLSAVIPGECDESGEGHEIIFRNWLKFLVLPAGTAGPWHSIHNVQLIITRQYPVDCV